MDHNSTCMQGGKVMRVGHAGDKGHNLPLTWLGSAKEGSKGIVLQLLLELNGKRRPKFNHTVHPQTLPRLTDS